MTTGTEARGPRAAPGSREELKASTRLRHRPLGRSGKLSRAPRGVCGPCGGRVWKGGTVLFLLCAAGLRGEEAGISPLPESIEWREIGPAAFGGRVTDIEVVPQDPNTIFVGAASGGVFKSVNRGITWKAVFDRAEGKMSIGDLAIAPSDRAVVWAGTGEANNRQSSSWGDGIYRSLDGGENWEAMGLEETQHIGRIVIHPRDSNRVFVAALGHLWGPNDERGVYRTLDGGKVWEKVLFIDQDTGFVDLAMEDNGRVLYAAAYQRRRRGWGFVGGGPGSGIYRSLNGGESWTRLRSGLPDGQIGRIGLAIARSHPETIYAIIEHHDGGVFRSDDRGSNWVRVNSLNPRPMYYSQIRVDPTNPDRVWVLGSLLFRSLDGGKSFSSQGTARGVHVDHHALWIDPSDPTHMLLGNDGGLWKTHDGAEHWQFLDNIPIAQFYTISVDDRRPYVIYGGTQDNGAWSMPSRTHSRLGITNRHVKNLAYGDGFFTFPDPVDPGFLYSESQDGRVYRISVETLEEQVIRPAEDDAAEGYRYNWKTPILASVHDPKVLYLGANRLLRSQDHGHSWQPISPDLTRGQDWRSLPIMGLVRDEQTLSRDDGVAHFGTITSLSESSLRPGLILVGTDDGQVQMTQDAGDSWTNLTSRFVLPGPRWVSKVLVSVHDARVAYVCFDGHSDDDFSPYLFSTDDGGENWRSLSTGLPSGAVLNVVAEHPDDPGILLAGSESGLFVTLNRGVSWHSFGGSLPPVPVDDILIHPREKDVVLGTHGRGLWILDDASFLTHLAEAESRNNVVLFPVRPSVQVHESRLLPRPGSGSFGGPNPRGSTIINYYLPETVSRQLIAESKDVEIEILDSEGKTVRSLKGGNKEGVNRVYWDQRFDLSFQPTGTEAGWFGPPRGPFVLPGKYRVVAKSGAGKEEISLLVETDPRARTSGAELKERLNWSLDVDALLGTLYTASDVAGRLRLDLSEMLSRKKRKDTDRQEKQIEEIRSQIEELHSYLGDSSESCRADLLDLLGQLQASSRRPTESQKRSIRKLETELRHKVERLNTLVTNQWPQLRQQLGSPDAPQFEPVHWNRRSPEFQ